MTWSHANRWGKAQSIGMPAVLTLAAFAWPSMHGECCHVEARQVAQCAGLLLKRLMSNARSHWVMLCAGVIYVMTHDSIGLGEDGPTHQPVEHLASFRAMPEVPQQALRTFSSPPCLLPVITLFPHLAFPSSDTIDLVLTRLTDLPASFHFQTNCIRFA